MLQGGPDGCYSTVMYLGGKKGSCIYPAALCVFLGEISKEDFRFIHKYKHTQGEVPGAAFLASDIRSLTLIVATHSTPTRDSLTGSEQASSSLCS